MKDTTVLVTSTLNIGINHLWKVISTIDETIWFPTMVKNIKIKGTGEGSVRYCTFMDGTKAEETIIKIDHQNKILIYKIQNNPQSPVQNMINQMELIELGNQKTEIKWSSSFHANNEIEEQMKSMLSGVFQTGLNELEVHCSQ